MHALRLSLVGTVILVLLARRHGCPETSRE